jgi:hypothetical protein
MLKPSGGPRFRFSNSPDVLLRFTEISERVAKHKPLQ